MDLSANSAWSFVASRQYLLDPPTANARICPIGQKIPPPSLLGPMEMWHTKSTRADVLFPTNANSVSAWREPTCSHEAKRTASPGEV
jgi:hypothetical protein